MQLTMLKFIKIFIYYGRDLRQFKCNNEHLIKIKLCFLFLLFLYSMVYLIIPKIVYKLRIINFKWLSVNFKFLFENV